MVRMSCKSGYVTSQKMAGKETTSLRNPTLTQFPFPVQKQSKAIKETTLKWDIGPYLVYLHALDIINQ